MYITLEELFVILTFVVSLVHCIVAIIAIYVDKRK